MTNKYLEKIASNHIGKGLISTAWQARAIAKDNGKQGDEGVGKHFTGAIRSGLRSGAQGALGGLIGGKLGGIKGQLAGGVAGAAHGMYASLKNQAGEARKKYQD